MITAMEHQLAWERTRRQQAEDDCKVRPFLAADDCEVEAGGFHSVECMPHMTARLQHGTARGAAPQRSATPDKPHMLTL